MGLIEKFKDNLSYYKLDKYTRRRLSQSQFESHDRSYYENAYRDGDYVDPQQRPSTPNRTQLSYKQSRWSVHELWRKSSVSTKSMPTQQLRTSETYTLGRS
ncbi:hypothetical protein BY458DRAFT_505032 [Sporodiniella umbellata]|nr:hypothetical protein BY458DRAFT_505032 [Sporodiniella umbellata]